ncbi:NACHT domain-containing protein [Kamptonema sp. UHCC 0994]|uniref:NACHT domain-containing protein n=1 Tax=Kamptonema sp. UHCC 0994 TaxID=3031329 RepID=UPI0023BA1776|nr:NACHT domain-containing protein [Kamptonema sp. UHCC 0994]MDF0555188.1 NACHT domain-containing protein [Kamptonema sp. UHCC 0994]
MLGFEPLIASATTNIVNIASETLLDNRGKLFGNLALVGQTLKARTKKSINQAAEEYVCKYIKRYGILRILGKSEPIPLESVYIPIQVWLESDINRCESLEKLETIYSQSEVRRWQFIYNDKLEGIEAANQNQYLMVLGEPGAGKSIFLRQIALEALKGKKLGKIGNSTYIPVFIDLKEVSTRKVNLEKIILEDFASSNFPFPEQLTAKALGKGKLLILLDGLNEVPENQFKNVILQIKSFVNKYPKNRFIISCRTDLYRHNLTGFVNVLISPFDENQLERFLCNWFHSDGETLNFNALACWEALQKPENLKAKELSINTLSLSLLCLVYERDKNFPKSRQALYEQVWQILLESGLSDPRLQLNAREKSMILEEVSNLFSEIAFTGFESNKLLFERRILVEKVKDCVGRNLKRQSSLDANLVLDAIVKPGILVSEKPNLLAFFHPTIQEYLTAQYILPGDYFLLKDKSRFPLQTQSQGDGLTTIAMTENDSECLCPISKNSKIQKLVTDRLKDERWQPVFLSLAEMMGSKAEKLLLLIETEAQKYINTPKLEALLTWANQITADSEGNIKPAAKRATALLISGGDFGYTQDGSEGVGTTYELPLETAGDFTFSRDFMLTMSRDRIFASYLAHMLGLDIGLTLARARILASTITGTLGLARTRIFADELTRELAGTVVKVRGRFLDVDFNFALDTNRDLALDRTRDLALVCILAREYEKLQISKEGNQFIAELEALQVNVPGNNEPLEVHRKFRDCLRKTWLKTFNISPEIVNLTATEREALGNYLYANCLMVQCDRAAGEINPATWEAIEHRMLAVNR